MTVPLHGKERWIHGLPFHNKKLFENVKDTSHFSFKEKKSVFSETPCIFESIFQTIVICSFLRKYSWRSKLNIQFFVQNIRHCRYSQKVKSSFFGSYKGLCKLGLKYLNLWVYQISWWNIKVEVLTNKMHFFWNFRSISTDLCLISEATS